MPELPQLLRPTPLQIGIDKFVYDELQKIYTAFNLLNKVVAGIPGAAPGEPDTVLPLYIQDDPPAVTGKYLWIQTNLGGNPANFTVYFEDGI